MAEPQPAEIHEGASTPPAPSGTAEDRKAAAALSNLDGTGADDTAEKRPIDAEALGQAIKNLEGGAGVKKAAEKKSAEKEVKNVKVAAADVNLVVEHTELSKAKATELLKANEGDAVKALTAWVSATV